MAQVTLTIDESDLAVLNWDLELGARNALWFIEARHSTEHERELGWMRLAAVRRLQAAALGAHTASPLAR